MMRAVAYCRVSTDSEDQLNSLENQITNYTELFKREGFIAADCGMYYSRDCKNEVVKYITAIFADEGISGTKLKNRKAFKYMIECAKRKMFDVIYVKNVSRWARSVEDGSGILKRLKVMGVKVIFEDGNLNNFEHEMTINILLSTAQEESRSKSYAVQFGIRKAQKQGKFTSAAPYGYKSENGYLKTIPEQLEIVKKIFYLYNYEGWGSTKITRYLNQNNISTQKGKKWTQTQIYDILTNEIYTGKQITHTVINTDINIDNVTHIDKFSNKEYKYRSRKPVDESEWIITFREDLRAISNEDFQLTQQENRKRRELHASGNRPSTQHIFSNLLYCQHCGKALRRKRLCTWKCKDGTQDLKHEWLCCNHDQYYNDVCRFRNSWEEKKLVDRVKAEITSIRDNKDRLDKFFNDYMKVFLNIEEVNERIDGLNTKLAEIKTEVNANLKLFARNIINEEQYKIQNDELQNNKNLIVLELKKLMRIEEEREFAKNQYSNYKKLLNSISIDKLSNILLRKVINRIEAFTYIDHMGKEVKELFFVWNMIDKSMDDVLLKTAEME